MLANEACNAVTSLVASTTSSGSASNRSIDLPFDNGILGIVIVSGFVFEQRHS